MASRLLSSTYWRASWIRFREPVKDFADCEPLLLTTHDKVQVRGLKWTPRSNPRPKVAVIAAHPRVDFSQHYAFPALLRAGYLCVGANMRSLNNDVNCVHEQLLMDIAAYVNWLKDECGVEKVVWLGNSGGGSLGCFYQQQAKLSPGERLQRTPAGKPVPLAEVSMPAFDAMMISAAHTGQGLIINETIDPSVLDEHNPMLTDPALDMYDPANGFKPAPQWTHYDRDFIARYRKAQLARVARIDQMAHAMLAERDRGEQLCNMPGFESAPLALQRSAMQKATFTPVLVTYRTMANPHYVDNTIDPTPRGYGSLLSDRPDVMNFQLLGFGRLQTPDAWLSTWSGLSSNANILKTGPSVTEPVVVVHAGRDLDVYPHTHSNAIFNALSSQDKTFLDFPNRLHYFEPEDDEPENAGALEQMTALLAWLESRCPL
jgi:alpha-beta hydrolase superfamily lysophospholipase